LFEMTSTKSSVTLDKGLASALASALASESKSDEKDEKDFVVVPSKSLAPTLSQPFTYSTNNGSRKWSVNGSVGVVLNADGYWTTSTSSAMATSMTVTLAVDNMFATLVKLFDEVRCDRCLCTIDFTEYESLLERSSSSASARSFALAFCRKGLAAEDYYYLMDRPYARLVSPSPSRRIVKFAEKCGQIMTSGGVIYGKDSDGFTSTSQLASVSVSDVNCGVLKLATSDTCGVAGTIRVRAQISCTFRGRRGSA